MSGGRKYDAGKARYDLIYHKWEDDVAKVLAAGSVKYADFNYLAIPHAPKRYVGALRRHLNAIMRGEWIDEETGLPHVSHLSCCAMMLQHWIEHHGEAYSQAVDIERAMDDLKEEASDAEASGEGGCEPECGGAGAAEAGVLRVRDLLSGERVPGLGGWD